MKLHNVIKLTPFLIAVMLTILYLKFKNRYLEKAMIIDLDFVIGK